MDFTTISPTPSPESTFLNSSIICTEHSSINFPEDIEDIVSKVENVLPGRVIAFGEDDSELGTEQVSVVAETKLETEDDFDKLRVAILRAGMEISVNIHSVYLVPSRWLIKSSSGKPSRKANRHRIISKTDDKVWSKR